MRARGMMLALVATMMVAASCVDPYAARSSADRSSPDASVASADVQLRVSYFYNDLDPWGRWVEIAPYGWCWSPSRVDATWAPYIDGSWVYTDYGWTWASNEPWGWATCHYGRWFFDDAVGWVWLPGTVWAPAWVAWRYDEDWVGWAPLPPDASWDVNFGLRFASVERIPARCWSFVSFNQLGERNIRSRIEPLGRNESLFRRTRDATRFGSRDGRPFDHGLDLGIAESRARRPIPRMKTVDLDSPSRTRERPSGGTIGVFRPSLGDARPDEVPRRVLQDRAQAMAPQERDRRRDEERRRLESDLARERTRLEQTQRNERERQWRDDQRQDLARRHAQQQREFREHAAERRSEVEKRWRPQPDRGTPARDTDRKKPASGRGHGHDRPN